MTSISQLLERAAGLGSGRIAVAAAHDEDVLRAVCAAKRENIAQPILVGHRDEITALLEKLGEAPAEFRIIDADTDAACAQQAVACVTRGEANFLMKGLLGTADLMRAVLNRDANLRTGRLLSHVMLYEPQVKPVSGL